MSEEKARVPIEGSARSPVPGAHPVGPANPNQRIEITLRLRRPSGGALAPQALAARPPSERRYLTRAELAASQGADPQDVAKVEQFAQDYNLDVVQVSRPRRTVRLAGTVADMNRAFGVHLQEWEGPHGRYRGREGTIEIPADLQGIVVGVFGLDNRPQARPLFRRLTVSPRAASQVAYPKTTPTPFTPPQVAKLYNFPPDADGQGETIALIELGGGYKPEDVTTYFGELGLPVPTVTAVSVDGAQNDPTTPDSADGEVLLDIEVAGGLAPRAQIVVYFAPNTDAGFLDAVTTVVHDTVHHPSIISISWGAAEPRWTQQAMTNLDQAFQEAAAVGISVYCASGDNGSGDQVGDNLAHVDFPASSPHATGCGGTHLAASGTAPVETVWNDLPNGGAGGGGISDTFALPTYQSDANVPPSANPDHRVGRGVPDVAGDAAPSSGYRVRVDGQEQVIGGTSAVAPLWAGLTALLNQKLGKPVGFLNPLIYTFGATAFNDVTQGNNGAYQAGPGWDACTGWGSPDGQKLLAALSGKPSGQSP